MVTSSNKAIFKMLLVFLVAGVLFTKVSFAQDATKVEPQEELKSIFKTNPFYAFGGWLPMTFEYFFKPNKSFMLGASYITNPVSWADDVLPNAYPFKTRYGFYVNPSIRFYLSKTPGKPGGFYASPEVGYIQQTKVLGKYSYDKQSYDPKTYQTITTTYTYPERKLTFKEYQGAVTIGYQFIVKDVFALDLYCGEGISIIRFQGGDPNAFYKQLNEVYHKSGMVPKDGSRLLAGFKMGVPF